MRQSGFLLIFDFQGANSEKVESNKNCLWRRADVCKNKTKGEGGEEGQQGSPEVVTGMQQKF